MLTVAATPDLVPFLLLRMTPEERAKLERVTHGQGEAQLRQNVERSNAVSWAGIDAGGVVNLGGVFPIANLSGFDAIREGPTANGGAVSVGYVWQVITPAVALHKRAYIRQGRAMQAAALAHFERLTTIISADYGAALRHIGRLGFDVQPPVQLGADRACRCDCVRSF